MAKVKNSNPRPRHLMSGGHNDVTSREYPGSQAGLASGVRRNRCALEPSDFKKWRKSLKLSQKEAAHALGLKRRMIQYYEKGERDGDKVDIPRSVRLACYALSEGVEDYHGPARKLKRRDDKLARDNSTPADEAENRVANDDD